MTVAEYISLNDPLAIFRLIRYFWPMTVAGGMSNVGAVVELRDRADVAGLGRSMKCTHSATGREHFPPEQRDDAFVAFAFRDVQRR